MFAADVPTTFTVTEFLLALFEGFAFVAALIWIKVVLYRRRIRENEALRLQRQSELDREMVRLTASNRSSPRAASDQLQLTLPGFVQDDSYRYFRIDDLARVSDDRDRRVRRHESDACLA